MVKALLSAATIAAAFAGSIAAPVRAQDLGDIVGGVARQYLQQEQDRAAFAQAQSSNTVRAYESYLQQFPSGAYAAEARSQIRRLGGAGPTEGIAEPGRGRETGSGTAQRTADDASGLTRQQRIGVQRQLNALGYDTNGTDGAFGPGTRRAIALWQRDRGYSQTGALTTAQSREILDGAGTRPGAGSSQQSRPALSGGSPAGVGPAGAEADLGLGRAERTRIQAVLTQLGYDTRGVDGAFGRGSRDAIARWQRDNGQPATGYLTANQSETLLGY